MRKQTGDSEMENLSRHLQMTDPIRRCHPANLDFIQMPELVVGSSVELMEVSEVALEVLEVDSEDPLCFQLRGNSR